MPRTADSLTILDAARILDAGTPLTHDHDVFLMAAPRFRDVKDRLRADGLLDIAPSGLMTLTDAGREALAAAA